MDDNDLRTQTVSLNDRLSDLKAEADEVRVEADQFRREWEPEEDGPDHYQQTDEWGEYRDELQALKGKISTFEDVLARWNGDGEFVIKELNYGEIMRAKDEVQRHSFKLNQSTGDLEGVPRDGFYRLKVVSLGVVDSPAAAPSDAEGLPFQVGEWLYKRIDALNSMGEVGMETFSLEAELEENSSPPTSSKTDSTPTE